MRFRKDLQWTLVPQLLEASLDPELATSTGLQAWVAEWSGSKGANQAALHEVRVRLEAEKGTFLEPFSLEPAEVGLAMLFVEGFYSAKPPTEPFRVVSGTSETNLGGLEFDLAGNFTYRERFAFAEAGCEGQSTNFYAPALRPGHLAGCDLALPTENATLALTAEGLELRIVGGARLAPVHKWETLQFEGGLTTSRVGLVVVESGEDLVFTAKSAEAMIRLEALCADSQTLVLGDKLSSLCLRPLEGETPTVLDSLLFEKEGQVDSWLSLPWNSLEVPDLPETLLPHHPKLFKTLQ